MANDAYPWTKEFGFSIIDVVQGLRPDQVAAYHKMLTDKYMKLGATSVEFTHQYSPNADVAAHAVVIGTPKNVFLAFRGTADIGQGWTSADISAVPHTAFNKTLQLYKAPYKSTMLAWQWALAEVRKAVAATDRPHSAKVYTTGHSLGGASAYISALLLREQGLNIGGVYAFGPYKTGTTCTPDQECWVTVYDHYLADVTSFWWNNQDPIPALLDSALGTTFANSAWGHVPRNKGWWRVVGDNCVKASGTKLADICPPEVDAADGVADGVCSRTLVEAHMPWVYLQKVARCTLLQDNRDSDSSRMDRCSRNAVWEGLLGLAAPYGRSESATVKRLGDLTAATPGQVDAAMNAALYGLRPAPGKL
ncbi:hypothetical protein OEZ85_012651 [Tetradesmus obliquus]|uniref:Fungal lipase-type domain-containing protein n=1 Tax=Tetradesmus obliquus TaxID=3088 RepID=A0ABY8U641_TETOB|nr:hypothetical protein OEZ85_012651 [Tetradesmus obliquus]